MTKHKRETAPYESQFLRKLVAKGVLTEQQANTAPTVDNVRKAFIAYAKYLTKQTAKYGIQLAAGLQTNKTPSKKLVQVAERINVDATAIKVLLRDARTLQALQTGAPSHMGSFVYDRFLFELLKYRGFIGEGDRPESHGLIRGMHSDINCIKSFTYLPKKAQMRFAARKRGHTAEAG